jgi:hypothetical protein
VTEKENMNRRGKKISWKKNTARTKKRDGRKMHDPKRSKEKLGNWAHMIQSLGH